MTRPYSEQSASAIAFIFYFCSCLVISNVCFSLPTYCGDGESQDFLYYFVDPTTGEGFSIIRRQFRDTETDENADAVDTEVMTFQREEIAQIIRPAGVDVYVNWRGYKHRRLETSHFDKDVNGNITKTAGLFQCDEAVVRSVRQRDPMTLLRTSDYKYYDNKRLSCTMSHDATTQLDKLTGKGIFAASDDPDLPYASTTFEFSSTQATWSFVIEHSAIDVGGLCYGKHSSWIMSGNDGGDTSIGFFADYTTVSRKMPGIDWIFNVSDATQLLNSIWTFPSPFSDNCSFLWMTERQLMAPVEFL